MDDHQPLQLPRADAELAEWSVYADALMARGDPLGERMAHELALPPELALEALRAFQIGARQACPLGGTVERTWRFGHVHTLAFVGSPTSHGALAFARDRVRAPRGRRLAALVLPADDLELARALPWRRFAAALPATCTRVELVALAERPGAIAALVAALPAQVDELVVRVPRPSRAAIAAAVTDRFARVELDVGSGLPPDSTAALIDAIATTTRVHAHVVGSFTPGIWPARVAIGGPDDAALVTDASGAVQVLARWSPRRRQRRSGLVPVRAQLADTLVETHLVVDRRFEIVTHVTHLLARRGARWTIRGEAGLAIGERPFTAGLHPIANGDRFTYRDVAYTLFTGEVDRQVRAVTSRRPPPGAAGSPTP